MQLEPNPVEHLSHFGLAHGSFLQPQSSFFTLQGSQGAAAPVSHGLHLFLFKKLKKPFFLHFQESIVDLHFEHVAIFGFTF